MQPVEMPRNASTWRATPAPSCSPHPLCAAACPPNFTLLERTAAETKLIDPSCLPFRRPVTWALAAVENLKMFRVPRNLKLRRRGTSKKQQIVIEVESSGLSSRIPLLGVREIAAPLGARSFPEIRCRVDQPAIFSQVLSSRSSHLACTRVLRMMIARPKIKPGRGASRNCASFHFEC